MKLSRIKIRRPNERTIRILKMIGVGVLMLGIGAIPPPWAVGRILRELTMKDTDKNRRWARRRVYEVHRQGYVRSDRDRYALSDAGQRFVDEQKIRQLQIRRPKRWDQEWHIVVFDIPQERSGVRIAFVRHLKTLGLIFYQRSVWIHAFPLEDEVREIANFYGLLPYVSFVIARHVDGSASLRKHFIGPA